MHTRVVGPYAKNSQFFAKLAITWALEVQIMRELFVCHGYGVPKLILAWLHVWR